MNDTVTESDGITVTRWPNALDARREALDQAIRVHSHKEECLFNKAAQIVEDAKVFEAYLKGEGTNA